MRNKTQTPEENTTKCFGCFCSFKKTKSQTKL